MAQRKQKDDPFKLLPLEMRFEIFSYLNKESFLVTRRVSKSWKFLADSSRNLRFTCDLTDATIQTVVNSNELIFCVRIHDFLGRDNRIVSGTRGIGRVLSGAESIQVIGRSINGAEVGKMIKFAVRNLEELLFQDCHSSLIRPMFNFGKPFERLRKLTLSFSILPTHQEAGFLHTLSSPFVAPQLQTIEHLKIIYELAQTGAAVKFPSAEEIFFNYMALARLILCYGASLKIVEIVRNDEVRNAIIDHVKTEALQFSRLQLDELQQCLQGLLEIQLDSFHSNVLGDEGEFPWILEMSLLQNQTNLKELLFENERCFIDQIPPQPFFILLPINPEHLTKIDMSLSISPGNEAVDFSPISQCPLLETLWLEFYLGVSTALQTINYIHFQNLEMLPKTIKSFHLKPRHDDTYSIHHLTQYQVRWIASNLKGLESIWLQLFFTIPAVGQVGAESHSNFDVQTFMELTSGLALKDFNFDILKLVQFGNRLEVGMDNNSNPLVFMDLISLQDVREFVRICEGKYARIVVNQNHEDRVRRVRMAVTSLK